MQRIGRIVMPDNEQKCLEKGGEQEEIEQRQPKAFLLGEHGTRTSVPGHWNKISQPENNALE